MTHGDPFDLQRFVGAQARNYEDAISELRTGRKRTHWMWYVFPQMKGLGHSPMAQRFVIASLDEAKAYLAHPVLGPRLLKCTEAMLAIDGKSALEILASPDDMKFRSSMTLFARATPDRPLFQAALEKYFNGNGDVATLELLGLN